MAERGPADSEPRRVNERVGLAWLVGVRRPAHF
jgi:hypothetical protein